jgi:phosphate starvation-inducible PhoH-like protein
MKNRSRQNSLDFGEEPNEDKRRARKSKKNNNAELMNEFRDEIDDESSFAKQRAYYENLHHLSSNERATFDAKFTKPKNDSQTYYATLLKQKSKKIVVATGPAGTGKTLFATEYGVKMFLTGQYEKLIFTRPSVSVDEDLGYLPGTLEDKMAPWVRPIYDVLYNFITPKEVTSLMEDKIIEISPLGFMRGRTFKNCWIVADEMQNSSISQMKMLMTRLGENSRLVVTGDLEQYDRVNEVNGLEDFLSKFKGKRSSSISSIEFYKSDIQREEVVKEVLDIYGGDMPADYITENIDDENENEK